MKRMPFVMLGLMFAFLMMTVVSCSHEVVEKTVEQNGVVVKVDYHVPNLINSSGWTSYRIKEQDSSVISTPYWKGFFFVKKREDLSSKFISDHASDGQFTGRLDEIWFLWEGVITYVHGDGRVVQWPHGRTVSPIRLHEETPEKAQIVNFAKQCWAAYVLSTPNPS